MKIIKTKALLQETICSLKAANKTIGLVPTMGALHAGHISLIHNAVTENDACIASIFVNPTQFNDKNDLAKYPRTLDADAHLLEKAGCYAVFAPDVEEMYEPNETAIPFEFDFGGLDQTMEGPRRPGHFNGVVQIVGKLFDLVKPDRAYFGEKDFQQLAIIRRMVSVYNLPITIVGCPIVRETNGLALSSRNTLLSPTDKQTAVNISRILFESKHLMSQASLEDTKKWVENEIEGVDGLTLEYYEIVDGNTLQTLHNWSDSDYIVGCITVHCGGVRLIDNIQYKNHN